MELLPVQIASELSFFYYMGEMYAKFIILNTQFIIFNTKIIIFNANIIMFNANCPH